MKYEVIISVLFTLFSEVRLVEILDGVCRHSDYDVSTSYLSCDQSHDLCILYSAIEFWRIMKRIWRFGGSNCKSSQLDHN